MSKNDVTFPLSKPSLSREKWTQGVYHSTPRRSSCSAAPADRSRPGAPRRVTIRPVTPTAVNRPAATDLVSPRFWSFTPERGCDSLTGWAQQLLSQVIGAFETASATTMAAVEG
jgi:hypothetical protein